MRRATIPQYGQRIAVGISIHALHEESDLRGPEPEGGVILISIHALHEESDRIQCLRFGNQADFNPRSP